MEPLEFGDLPEDALVLVASAPIVYFLEGHPKFGPRFKPLFDAHAAGRLRFAVTTITIAEVLTGPLQAADDALVRRYRAILESWRPVALDIDIAESAARLRASLRLELADAVQAASALAINAAAPGDARPRFFSHALAAHNFLMTRPLGRRWSLGLPRRSESRLVAPSCLRPCSRRNI